jgi:hypothetical protein
MEIFTWNDILHEQIRFVICKGSQLMGLVKVGVNKSYDLRKQKTVLFVVG